MKERLITSVVLIAFLLIVGVINNIYLTGLLVAVIAIAGMWEAKKLFEVEDDNVFYFLAIMAFLSIFSNPVFIAVVSVLVVGGYIAYYQKDLNLISLSFYPLLPLMLLLDLYHKTTMGMIGWLIVIIAATDSFAYIIGKNFAKKFFNQGFCKTSPNKSWEGVIGGVVIGTILGSIVGLAFFDFPKSFLISFVVSIAGVFGDLFESYLKRRAGVKDSGNILPGHGGVLDRIDAYLFGAPLMWALVVLY
ncbi:phosphatidate cytidylyltransferase [Caminibacter pacificus]|jgi:phosphatidate cytidylyltransferase|uniref:Phosphatidate cytidylyltransferase n=1 Tax=Caminibacter pacificus TaxID=1424653 RepID=A0AAJ4RCZ8_9BACT|nr:phosphatidate cytidylyltransferase [Caminibacter pacificus]NPA87118.1 phosphatidate cytidylyltransferase [Campylobacterota bacterium]QCI27672.1 CDP-archaeol synthase [Caminibacter pacificus]ROR40153.1 phosphatidate cytidylyltransferase [Caminibacter pacificus]